MRAGRVILAAALCWAWSAAAQVGPLPGMMAAPVMANASATRAFTGGANTGSDNTFHASIDFGTISFGTAAPNRFVIVAVSSSGASSGVTIAGTAATLLVNLTGASSRSVALYGRAVPTGASGNVTVSFSGAGGLGSIGVYALYRGKTQSVTPTATSSSSATPASTTLATPANGVVIATFEEGGGGSCDPTWTGPTKDNTQNWLTSAFSSYASQQLSSTSPSSETVTAAGCTASQLMAAASWSP